MIGDVLAGILRLAHALTAALWVGGTLTFALVNRDGQAGVRGDWRAFREALRLGIGIFVVTGAILTLERLSSAALPPIYMGVLAVKVGLGIWMFLLARGIGRAAEAAATAWWERSEIRVVALGVVIYGLAAALKVIYEDTIRFGG